jgi:hypothetical protein
MKQAGKYTSDMLRRSLALLQRRRKLLPFLMIAGGTVLFVHSTIGFLSWIVGSIASSPHNMSMHAQVEWARYLSKVHSPAASFRVDVLRKPVPATINNTGVAQSHKPIAMIGIFMMDTPQSAFARKILRLAFPANEVLLRFVICRPTAITILEGDVLPIDMKENMNNGKTQRWFAYAAKNRPPSVEAIFKMDDDVLFCWNHLKDAIVRSRKFRYGYYGRYIDHAECGQYFHCPPPHCNGRTKFVGDCYYYMQGGLYGFSAGLLGEIERVPMFQIEQEIEWHEDIMAGQWVNQTASRALVAEVPFWPYHDKSLVKVETPKYENVIKAYGDALWQLKCVTEYVNVIAELDVLHKDAKWYLRRKAQAAASSP